MSEMSGGVSKCSSHPKAMTWMVGPTKFAEVAVGAADEGMCALSLSLDGVCRSPVVWRH